MRKNSIKGIGERIFTIFVLICFISGCSSQMKFTPENFQKSINNKYPPVSVIINNGVIRSVVQQDFNQGITSSFERSGLFNGVLTNESEWPLKFDITISMSEGEKEWSNFGLMLFSALSLFLIPVQTYHEIKMDVAVTFKGKEINDYSYTLKGGKIMHLFIDPVSDTNKATNTLVSYFLNDIQKEKLLLPIQNQYRKKLVGSN